MTPTLPRLARSISRVLALAGLAFAATAVDATSATAQSGSLFGHMPEVANYRLTTPALQKFVRATNALKELEDQEFDLDDRLDVDDPSELTLDRLVAAFDSEPQLRRAVEGAGMSTREYVTFMLAMVQTVMGSVMVQMGGEQALRDMPAGVMKDNIQFFLDNEEAFDALDG
jgi:hypothetical protein